MVKMMHLKKSDILFDPDDTSRRLKEFVDSLSRFALRRGQSSEGKIDPEFLIAC